MHFWPASSTLTEDGGPTGAPAAGNSGGGAQSQGAGSIFSSGAGMPALNAGEIMLSRAESAALAALETEPNEAHGVKRARQESGLTDSQIKILQRRAKHALSKGITLKGVGFTRKPTGGPPEEPSLLRKAKSEEKAAQEALREKYREASPYGLPAHSDWKYPVPHSEGSPDPEGDSVHLMKHAASLPRKGTTAKAAVEETNTESTFAKVTAASRMRRRKRENC
jgi:hypothetical protein